VQRFDKQSVSFFALPVSGLRPVNGLFGSPPEVEPEVQRSDKLFFAFPANGFRQVNGGFGSPEVQRFDKQIPALAIMHSTEMLEAARAAGRSGTPYICLPHPPLPLVLPAHLRAP
jgi:hypothetical protein